MRRKVHKQVTQGSLIRGFRRGHSASLLREADVRRGVFYLVSNKVGDKVQVSVVKRVARDLLGVSNALPHVYRIHGGTKQ